MGHVACEHTQGATSVVQRGLGRAMLVLMDPLSHGGHFREREEQGVAVAGVAKVAEATEGRVTPRVCRRRVGRIAE